MLDSLTSQISYMKGFLNGSFKSQTDVPAFLKGLVGYQDCLKQIAQEDRYVGSDRAQQILSLQGRKAGAIHSVLRKTHIARDNARQIVEGLEAALELALLLPRDGESIDACLGRLSTILSNQGKCPFPLAPVSISKDRIIRDRKEPENNPNVRQGVSSVVYRENVLVDADKADKNEEVAVKCFFPLHGIYFPPNIARYGFWRELSIQGKVNHAGECRVASAVHCFDYGCEEGIPYTVMPAMEGSLDDLAISYLEGRISYQRLLDSILPVTKALSQVHASSILHRDMKAGNILYRGCEWFLCDFSMATTKDEVVDMEQGREHFVGTYAPHQALGEIKLPLGFRLVMGGSGMKASAAIDTWALSVSFLMALGAVSGFSERYTDDFIDAFLKDKRVGHFGILPSFKRDYDFSKIPTEYKTFLKRGLRFGEGYRDGATMLEVAQRVLV